MIESQNDWRRNKPIHPEIDHGNVLYYTYMRRDARFENV